MAERPNSLRNPWLAVVLLLGVAGGCVALGFWQMGRATESRAFGERIAAAADLPPVTRLPREEGASESERVRFRKLALRGRYVAEPQFLLDNIVRDGVPGFYVLTPFAPAGSSGWVVVNRGWVRGDPARRVLPDVAVPEGVDEVVGSADALPAAGLDLGADAPTAADADVLVLSYPTMAELERLVGRPLFRYQLLLDAGQPGVLAPALPAAAAMTPERHLAYAGQWWLFAAVAAGAATVIAARARRRSG